MQEPTFPDMPAAPDPGPPVAWWHREEGRYQRCAWLLCKQDSSDRYPLPLCQEHALYIWSFVDEDMRASGLNGWEELDRLHEENVQRNIREGRAHAPAIKDRSGYVYILEVGGMIKIGFTANPFRRGGQYPPSAELLALYPGKMSDEKALHDRFSAYREAGREWYMDCREIRDYVAELNEAAGTWEKSMFRKRKRSSQVVRGVRERGYKV